MNRNIDGHKPGVNISEEQRNRDFIDLPTTATLSYHHKDKTFRCRKTSDLRTRLDTICRRRKNDSKLVQWVGKTPKGLKN